MKQILFSLIFLISIPVFSQNTTEEEYHYLTEEYWKDQRTLSIKYGYKFDKKFEKDISISKEQQTCGPYMDKKDFYIRVNDFVRKKDNSLAGVSILVVPQYSYDSYYFAIPVTCGESTDTTDTHKQHEACYLKIMNAFNSRLEYMNSDMKAAVRQVLAERDQKYKTNYKEAIK